jgi:hypothetical protein
MRGGGGLTASFFPLSKLVPQEVKDLLLGALDGLSRGGVLRLVASSSLTRDTLYRVSAHK